MVIDPRFPIPCYLFFGLFVAVSAAEIFCCYKEWNKWRKILKTFCVGFLLLAAIMYNPSLWVLHLGIFFGALGDALLIKKHKVLPFVLGTFAFYIGHILYIVQYVLLVGGVEWYFYATWTIGYILFLFAGYYFMRKIIHHHKLAFGGTAYFGILVSDFIWAVIACALGKTDFLFLAALGGFAFIVSDCFLIYTSFKKDLKRRDFFIMSTYLLAQVLIVLGVLFTK